ncbi:MAG: hypothetical protein IJY43_01100, partial [Clostridia bacterium]|nr:hypothetical protein [Clostridia bacterium]
MPKKRVFGANCSILYINGKKAVVQMDVLAIIIMLPFLVVFLWAIIEMLIVNPIQKKRQKPQIPPISQTPEESLPTFILFDNEEIVPAISEVAEKKEVFEEYPLVG